MIAYEVLCQAIADWKAGARPSASHTPGVVPEGYEDVESYDVNADEMLAVDSEAIDVADDETAADADEAAYAAEAEHEGEHAAEDDAAYDEQPDAGDLGEAAYEGQEGEDEAAPEDAEAAPADDDLPQDDDDIPLDDDED